MAEFTLPPVANMAQAAAVAKLEGVCSPHPCFNVTVKREDSQAVGIDQAIRSEPGEGAKLTRGADVTLVVSNGFTYTFNNRFPTLDIFTYPATFTCNGKAPIWKLEPIPYKIIATPVPTAKPSLSTKSPFILKTAIIKDWFKFLNFCPDFVSGPDLILTDQIQSDVFYPGMIAIKFDLSEIASAGSLEKATLRLYLKSLGSGTTDMDVYVSAATSAWDAKSGRRSVRLRARTASR